MARSSRVKPSSARRIFGSALLKMLIFVVLLTGLFLLVIGRVDARVQEEQVDFLADAVRRAAVQSYALEGRFPAQLSHLEENYGLIIDHQHYAVYYEFLGDNLLPQIRVIPLSK